MKYMKLIIVESPAKIKTINTFLGKEYTIMSTMGHVKDLPQKRLGITMNDGIDIDYTVMDDKEDVIAKLRKAAANASEIYLAPDPDREGEMIAWHVAQELQEVTSSDVIKRIAFHEITKPAIEKALASPSEIDHDKVKAQQARRVLDRWVGYEVSPILWKKIAPGLSAGRVQSVALRLICDREKEIQSFTPQEYWSIDGVFTTDSHNTFTATLHTIKNKKATIKTQKTADKHVEAIKQQSYTIESIKDTTRRKNPVAPFMTSTLQQAAYTSCNFSVDKTMQVAQKLYEGVPLGNDNAPTALITYMRTDSLRVSDVALQSARSFIHNQYGNDYLPRSANRYSKQNAQDAHEAIRPIDVTQRPEDIKPYVSHEQYTLYNLIWKRFVASQMTPAQYAQRQVLITGGDYTCKVTGSSLIYDGFLKVYQQTEEEDEQKNGKASEQKLPSDLHEGKTVTLDSVHPKQHFTQPPSRYTQASLVKTLEKEGIGRPSTYATILKTIRARAYTELDSKKRFVPTELGMAVTKMLTEHLPDIMDKKFTARMEEDLDTIAKGDLQRDKLLKDFYANFSQALDSFGDVQKRQTREESPITCPECGDSKLLVRFGKSGAFLGCPNYPECKYTTNFERQNGTIVAVEKKSAQEIQEEKKKRETNITCPRCEDGKLMIRYGRRGAFLGCQNYPKCTHTANFTYDEQNNVQVVERQQRQSSQKSDT